MILTIDIGNTNITFGAFRDGELLFSSRIATDVNKMQDEYAVTFINILKLYNSRPEEITGGIFSSVVPPLTPVINAALKKISGGKFLSVSPGVKTGLNIKIDDPSVLGSDMVCTAVAAMAKYTLPCVIFDLGTATKISAVNRDGEFLGCSILPGIKLSLESLASKTAQLTIISHDENIELIGVNTAASVRSGVFLGTASLMDGMADKYREILGEDAVLIATGGFAHTVLPFCRRDFQADEHLVLHGLYAIYKKNAR